MKQNMRFQGGICPQKSNLSNSKCPILLAFIDFNMPDIWQTVQIARPLLWKNVRVREGCTLKKLYHAGVAEDYGGRLVSCSNGRCSLSNEKPLQIIEGTIMSYIYYRISWLCDLYFWFNNLCDHISFVTQSCGRLYRDGISGSWRK